MILALALASILVPFTADRPAAAAGLAIDPLLTQKLAQTLPFGRLEAILTYNNRPMAADVAAARATGLLVHEYRALPMLAVYGTPAQIRAALALPGIRSAYANKPLRLLTHESVPLIGADRVWNELGFTGAGVGVAIIDSGIDATHADLSFGDAVVQNVKVAPNIFTGGGVVLENLPVSDTTSGHGTHCAGTIGGRGTASNGFYKGVAPGCSLIGISTGEAISVLFALEGFDYVLANKDRYNIRVISNSWGTTGDFAAEDPINVASKQAHDVGIFVAFAAGNEGPGENTLNPYSVAPWVTGVAAGEKDGVTLASFSSRGRPGDPLYHPTITAPGVDIASTRAKTGVVINALGSTSDIGGCVNSSYLLDYTCSSGTSMATPHIAGVAALMRQANPGLTPDQIKSILTSTAKPMPGYQEWQVGAGYVDAYAATAAAESAP